MFGIGDDSDDMLPLEDEVTVEAEVEQPAAQEPQAVETPLALVPTPAPAPTSAPATVPALSGYTKASTGESTWVTLAIAGLLLWLLSKKGD